MPLDSDDFPDPRGRRLSALVVAVTDDDFVRHEPPPDLWDSVADRIAGAGHGGVGRGDAVGPATPPQVVTSLDVRRRRVGGGRRTRYLLAAAAVVVAVVTGSALVLESRPSAERVVARATLRQLEPLGDTAASARLVTRDGTTRLVVEAKRMRPAPPGDTYELWLIDTNASDPRSLGVVTGSEEVPVPASINPKTHPIVDISLEPNDGNHRHSGHSLMRGTLN